MYGYSSGISLFHSYKHCTGIEALQLKRCKLRSNANTDVSFVCFNPGRLLLDVALDSRTLYCQSQYWMHAC